MLPDLARVLPVALCVFALQAAADSLDNLPTQWQQLKQVAQVEISTLKVDEQKAITDALQRV
jgi:hypothetical protein